MYKATPMQPERSVCVEHKLELFFNSGCDLLSVETSSAAYLLMKFSCRCKKKRKT